LFQVKLAAAGPAAPFSGAPPARIDLEARGTCGSVVNGFTQRCPGVAMRRKIAAESAASRRIAVTANELPCAMLR
jgi:hypothetical protein